MGKRANPALVGAFVIGAVVLVVVAVAVLGSGRFFRTTYPYIVYFTGNVNGLNVGAPVKFKGVPVGQVTSILLNAGEAGALQEDVRQVRIPVIIELDAEQVAGVGAKVMPDPQTMKKLVERGLRARLTMQSFVTDLLYVELDLLPDSEIRLVGDPTVRYAEIPSVPTPLEEVQAKAARFLSKLQDADIEGMIESLSNTAAGLDRLVNSPDLQEVVAQLPKAIGTIDSAVGELKTTLASVRDLSNRVATQAGPLGDSLERTATDASGTLKAAQLALEKVDRLLNPDSPLVYQLGKSLDDISAAARAMRLLVEQVDRNPSVLIRGRARPEQERNK